MSRRQTLKAQMSEARTSPDYWAALASLQFAQGLRRMMGGMKQTDLARLLDKSEAYVSRVLNGLENMTLAQMSAIAHQLGAAVHVHVARQDRFVDWVESTKSPEVTSALAGNGDLEGLRAGASRG